jgi:arabinogalactan endo-1,4-beta-galactosidase
MDEVEAIVNMSRKLYAKGVDVTPLVRILRDNADFLTHYSEKCYVPGILYRFHGVEEVRSALFNEIDKAQAEGKITSSEALEAKTAFDKYRTAKEKEALRLMEEKCGCRWTLELK